MASTRDKPLPLPPGIRSAVTSGSHDDETWQSDDDRDETVGWPSIEPTEDDQALLFETEEQEKLLHKPTRLEAFTDRFRRTELAYDGMKPVKRKARAADKAERRKSRGEQSEDGHLMFEMEEGFKDNSSTSSQDSIDLDRAKWSEQERLGPKPNGWRIILMSVASLVVLVLFAFGAVKVSRTARPKMNSNNTLKTLSNGTHLFAPTTIYVSLDGFRADFVDRGFTPALNAFIKSGVSPRYMLPSFPSVTFPNHYTLVTGLYPESHGIVGNQFWDPEFQEEFYYTNLAISMQPKWWTAEPIWVTAEKNGIRTAIHMWPGSEAHIRHLEPTYLDKYNGTEILQRKVHRILDWLDLPGEDDISDLPEKRPQLIMSYVPDVDQAGHMYGPNTTEMRVSIVNVDSMLLSLVEGLHARNLTEIVNLVVVSDHGMATTSNDRLIQLDDLIDMSLVDHIDGWPLRGLRLKHPERDHDMLYRQLMEASEKAGTFDVYTPETMPERYHFKNNDRIAPLWVVPKVGWAVVEKVDFNVAQANANGRIYEPKGLHGYDHEHPLMRAIFIARGPAFPHQPNSRLEPFQNTEVYNIICDSIGFAPLPNNGTIRLPFQPSGLHSDENAPVVDLPDDFGETGTIVGTTSSAPTSLNESPPPTSASPKPVTSSSMTSSFSSLAASQTKSIAAPESLTSSEVPTSSSTQPPPPPSSLSPSPSPTGAPTNENKEKGFSWLDFLNNQLQKAKDWAKEFVKSVQGNNPNNPDKPV